MHSAKSNRPADAFTLVEMLVTIGIIALLAALLLPALNLGKQRAKQVVCENQLQQIGIAFQSFAHDHDNKFPMQVAADDGGSLEFVQNGYLVNGPFYFEFRHFQPLADILATPKILICPADTRLPATNFNTLQNSNLSYFIGITAEYTQPMSVLAGDGNLASTTTLLRKNAGSRLTWTATLHHFRGNVLFADGHVEEWGNGTADALSSSGDFVLPSVGGGGENDGQSLATDSSDSGSHSSAATSTNEATSFHPATNQPSNPTTNPLPAVPSLSTSHDGMKLTASGQTKIELSNSYAENAPAAVTNNSVSGAVSKSDSDDSTMSPFNRRLANFLHHAFFGIYLLLLLLLLLLVAYRIWRWMQDRKRHQKSGRMED